MPTNNLSFHLRPKNSDLNAVFTETKPPEDLLKEDKIKIVPITEVKGVQGKRIRFINAITSCVIRSFVDV